MKITAIKAAVKTRGRFNIFVDEKYSFSLDELQLVSSGVRTGKELTEAELAGLKDDSTFGKAYARALDFIMRRVRSEKELRDYAWKKQWPAELTDRVMNRLRDKGYINDAKFAEIWVRHRALGKPMSQRKVVQELKQKGIGEELITAALTDDKSDFDEIDALKRLIEKKRSKYDSQQKLIAYLAGQGFAYDAIKHALQQSDEAL
jgi:regulatory protein